MLGSWPKAVGAVFGLRPGGVSAAYPGITGVIVVRQDELTPGSAAQFELVKGQLSQRLLLNRQQRYLRAWIDAHRARAKVEDLRPSIPDLGT